MVPEDVASGGKFSLVSGQIIISLVLVLLTCIWLSVVQLSKSSKIWIILEACELGGSSSERVESSTYLTMEQPADRSLMTMRNDSGPIQEPWGIPPVSGFQEDKHWLARTLCWWSAKYKPNHRSRLSGMANCFNLWKSTLWLTKSNAFRKSTKTERTEPPLSKLFIQLCRSARTACVVDLPLRLPNCLSSRCGSNNCRRCWPTMDSSTFASTGRIAIGLRSLSIQEGGLVLGTGTTWTDFHTGVT